MNVLGIDYGRRHVGIAIGDTETGLSEPFATFETSTTLPEKFQKLVVAHGIHHIVVGISEKTSATDAANFAHTLKQFIRVPVSLIDESLSSIESTQALLGAPKKKRRQLRHAAAAAIILERWLEEMSAQQAKSIHTA